MHAHDRLKGLTLDQLAQYAKDHGFEDWEVVAAAPELLEALKAVMEEWRDGYGLHCVEQVRTAIEKAGG